MLDNDLRFLLMSARKNAYFDLVEIVNHCNGIFSMDLKIKNNKFGINIFSNILNNYDSLFFLGCSIGVINKGKNIDIVTIDQFIDFNLDDVIDYLPLNITTPSVEALFEAVKFINKDDVTLRILEYTFFNDFPVKGRLLIYPDSVKEILLLGYYTYYFSELS